jgi:hypothetical protein
MKVSGQRMNADGNLSRAVALRLGPILGALILILPIPDSGENAHQALTSCLQDRESDVPEIEHLLGMKYPFHVGQLEILHDGGNVWGAFVDSSGTEFPLFFDWVTRRYPDRPYLDGLTSGLHNIRWGANQPYDPRTTIVLVGSDRERAIVSALWICARAQLKPGQADSLLALSPDQVRTLSPKLKETLLSLDLARFYCEQAANLGQGGTSQPAKK